ncbi:cation:proton antiporter [Mastigocoleus sp. MO_188.B34]|uniref:cation:proton antiporter n=1 Tax=Mastigocoleus sp. MO_188.B34 TaxID=3036635 RepID=UPI00262DBCF8|nr:cation:proton antiporter [Mastigocoleus sp. MO_188.B34]MDJ0696903.1 cation:proton antiporter [Mastigocoleus sp. MO_188.B34]
MTESVQMLPLLVLLMGLAITIAIFAKALLGKIGIPALVAYLTVGFLLKLADTHWHLLSQEGEEIFEFLAEIGIISLLFRVGLESDLLELLNQLPKACGIFIGNVVFSGALGFITSYFLLHIPLTPSLFVAIALTATSVGVAVGVWNEENTVQSQDGKILLDVAELDDIASVVLMALLFAAASSIHNGHQISLIKLIAKTSGIFFLKAILFAAFCLFFSRYLEKKLTRFFNQIEKPPDPMLEIVGVGFIIAAIAELLGFSVAIGAFFAGLVFSRDAEAVKIDASFGALYELFTPFFFIGIGLKVDPSAFNTGLRLGCILLIAAILGKLIGAGIPAFFATGCTGAVLIGSSMIPRAEICMIVMQRGLQLGDWAVPPNIFSAMVFVCTATSIITPVLLHFLFKQLSPVKEGSISYE